jgi:hypothetical protein
VLAARSEDPIWGWSYARTIFDNIGARIALEKLSTGDFIDVEENA